MLAVMLFQHGFVHTVQLLAGQDGEQAPAKVQALVDGAVLIGGPWKPYMMEICPAAMSEIILGMKNGLNLGPFSLPVRA